MSPLSPSSRAAWHHRRVIWLWVVVLVVIIGAIAVVVAGRDDALADVYEDRPDATLPTGRPLTAEDIEGVRLSTAVRGYRMDEVDALLARVQSDLRARKSSDTVTMRPEARAQIEPEPRAELERRAKAQAQAEPESPQS